MSRCILSAVVGASLIFAGGCLKSAADGRVVLQEQLDAADELGRTLAGIQDKAGVAANTAKVKTLCDQLLAVSQKALKTRVMKSTEEALGKEFEAKFEASGEKIADETLRVSQIEGGGEILTTIQTTLSKLDEMFNKKK